MAEYLYFSATKITSVQGCLVALVFLTAFPGFGASIVNAVGGGT